jgi:pimeloyl-ACP methyl ester carboxylesterase
MPNSQSTAPRAGRSFAFAPKGLAGLALGAGAALTGLAAWTAHHRRETEAANPPMGGFMEVGGVRLHVLSRGAGRPVVFIHGIGGMVQDWTLSVLELVARQWHAIAFDRPGHGWSARPSGRCWGPERQAELLMRAVRRMGGERPVLVAHSFGTLVALAWALDWPEDVAALVLVSGYYYPTGRLDLPLLAARDITGLGAVARHTLLPLLGKAALPKLMEKLFEPAPVPAAMALYPAGMMLRADQIRAQAEDLGQLRAAARRLSPRYGEISVPVVIVAGDSDRVVDPVAHSIHLHRDIPHSALKILPETGHMPHHTKPGDVLAAIDLAWHEAEVQARALMAPHRPAGSAHPMP